MKTPPWHAEDVSLHGAMLQEYYLARLRELRARRARRLAALHGPEDVLRLREQVRRKLRRCLGPFPRRTPLGVHTTSRHSRRDFLIETLLYESRPGVPVTANLYIPRQGVPPYPAVLGVCGHANEGKHSTAYQAFAQGLAGKGFLTLLIDPIGQGERSQYPGNKAYPYPQACAAQHTMLGNAMRLTGDFFGAWRIWDGLRGLDVLLARAEADRRHVGVTGNSGGGTLTSYLNAMDDRVTMAAPSCFVTTGLHNLENENLADQEQNPPGLWAAGLDMADYFIAQAPRPVILLGKANDFFDRRGLEQTYAELRRIYGMLGKRDRIRLFIGPGPHGYAIDNREAMYGFFQECCGLPVSPAEPRRRPLPAETLWATPTGQVLRNRGVRPVYTFTAERAAALSARRKAVDSMAVLPRLLRLPPRRKPPHYRILPSVNPDLGGRCYQYTTFALETEAGIQAHLHCFDTAVKHYQFPRARQATVVVAHAASRGEFMTWRPRPSRGALFFLDVRGIGVSRPLGYARKDAYHFMRREYYYPSQAQMLGEPLIGRRTHDVLCALDLFAGLGFASVHLAGVGLGTLPATFAACLHPLVRRVTLRHPLLSYEELTRASYYAWPLSALVPDVLQHLDLPDCYRALATRGLRLEAPWNALMRPWPVPALKQHLRQLGLPQSLVAARRAR